MAAAGGVAHTLPAATAPWPAASTLFTHSAALQAGLPCGPTVAIAERAERAAGPYSPTSTRSPVVGLAAVAVTKKVWAFSALAWGEGRAGGGRGSIHASGSA